MKRFWGKFLRVCAFAALAAQPRVVAWGQGTGPVTQVVPAASPSAGPEVSPQVAASPPANNAGPGLGGGAAPAPAITGTAPALGEIAPAISGTAPTASGTALMLMMSGSLPTASGTAPVMSGTAPLVSGSAAISGSATAAAPSPPPSPYSIEIDLGRQRAYLLKDGKKIAESPISSGREGHATPTGNFAVIQKDLNHFSNLYGKIVEKDSGRLVKSGADAAMPVPKGCKFVPAPMKWFMRFDGAAGMHAGILPGYAASHGCVRMPASKAEMFYSTVEVGTPVHVFGSAPEGGSREEHAPRRLAVATARPAPVPVPTPRPRPHWWF